MGYVSYLQFFTELKQLLQDMSLEFSCDDYLHFTDSEFDIKYTTFLTRLQKRCKDYSEGWFFGPSRFVGKYVSEISNTKSYPRSERFVKLLEITDRYMRMSLVR